MPGHHIENDNALLMRTWRYKHVYGTCNVDVQTSKDSLVDESGCQACEDGQAHRQMKLWRYKQQLLVCR